jgi:hypothetical protein
MRKKMYDDISDIANKIQDLADELPRFVFIRNNKKHYMFDYERQDLYKVIKEIRDFRDHIVSNQGLTETNKEEA